MEFFSVFVKVITENPLKRNSVTMDLLNSLTKTAMLENARVICKCDIKVRFLN